MRKAMVLLGWMALLVMMAAVPPSPGFAQSDAASGLVHVIGTSQIRGGDMPAARQEAIEEGLVTAVSRVLIDLLPAESVAGNFQVINESILNHKDQFIQDYKVLAESQLGGTYRLIVAANVSVARLDGAVKNAGIRLGKVSFPRVLVCIAEQGAEDLSQDYWWSGQQPLTDRVATDAVTRALLQAGFKVVQPQVVPGAAMLPAQLSLAQAQALGQQQDAEVVVVGLASAEAADTGTGSLGQSSGSVAVRAVRVEDGRLLADIRESARSAAADPQAGSREAMRQAADQAGAALATRVAAAWRQQSAAAAAIALTIDGIGGHIADFVKFRSALGSMSGVDNLQVKEMMPNAATLTVQYQGPARALADAVSKLVFDSFVVDIQAVEGKHIRLRLAPR
ncbi:hypothetical protein [Desulfatitalea tepidiphila]|uniref:hypothetical protein n=1 Tax=Desulfatitalea tepidiphila TaxID=1185843 RepID=UPI00128FBC5D|nr:hypothetical protein [Desulfatitalea tepidiphila]